MENKQLKAEKVRMYAYTHAYILCVHMCVVCVLLLVCMHGYPTNIYLTWGNIFIYEIWYSLPCGVLVLC